MNGAVVVTLSPPGSFSAMMQLHAHEPSTAMSLTLNVAEAQLSKARPAAMMVGAYERLTATTGTTRDCSAQLSLAQLVQRVGSIVTSVVQDPILIGLIADSGEQSRSGRECHRCS